MSHHVRGAALLVLAASLGTTLFGVQPAGAVVPTVNVQLTGTAVQPFAPPLLPPPAVNCGTFAPVLSAGSFDVPGAGYIGTFVLPVIPYCSTETLTAGVGALATPFGFAGGPGVNTNPVTAVTNPTTCINGTVTAATYSRVGNVITMSVSLTYLVNATVPAFNGVCAAGPALGTATGTVLGTFVTAPCTPLGLCEAIAGNLSG
jgi:hypothetical protein